MYIKESCTAFCDRLKRDFSTGCLPEEPTLTVAPHGKLDERGILTPFSGTTVVWELSPQERAELIRLQREIAYPCLKILGSQRLPSDSLHVTLHDLISTAGSSEASSEAMERLEQARLVLSQAADALRKPIALRSWRMVSMVSKSIVLLLTPETVEDWERLSTLYDMLQTVVPLDYPATPHITLGYYRSGAHDTSAIRAAIDIPCSGKRFVLRPESLMLQRFSDMAHYYTVAPAFPDRA